MKPQALCGMRFAGGWYNPEIIGETAGLCACQSLRITQGSTAQNDSTRRYQQPYVRSFCNCLRASRLPLLAAALRRIRACSQFLGTFSPFK